MEAMATSSAGWIAALPMYDFAAIQPDNDILWTAIATRLRDSRLLDPAAIPATLDRSLAYDRSWEQSNLLLSQSCGWPIVGQLEGRVQVVGSFANVVGPSCVYRSVLVAGPSTTGATIGEVVEERGRELRVAINGWDSLSGYVSLGIALSALALATTPLLTLGKITVSGAHAESAALLSRGDVDLISIDGHTYWLFEMHRSELVADLRIVGVGPQVPTLPLITAATTPPEVIGLLGSVLSDVAIAEDRVLSASRTRLGITGFVPFGNERYEPIRDLQRRAARALASPSGGALAP